MTNSTTSSLEPKTQPWWVKLLRLRVVIPTILVLALFLSPFAYRSYYLAGVPEIDHPFDVEAFGTVEISYDENAYHDYKLAIGKLAALNFDKQKDLDTALDGTWNDATPGVRRWLKDNQEALELWRVGTVKSDYLATQPKDYEIYTLLPVAQELRTFARLTVLQGNRLEAEGKFDEAWKWYRAMFRSSRHPGQHGCLIEQLIGIAMHAIVTKSIIKWASNPQVTSSQIQKAINEVTADYELTAPNSTSFKSEYFVLENTLNDPAIFKLASSFSSMKPTDQLESHLLKTCRIEPQLSRMLNRHFMKNLLTQVDKPRYLRNTIAIGQYIFFDNSAIAPSDDKTLTPTALEEAIMRTLYLRVLTPAYSSVLNAADRSQTQQNLLVVILAVRKYKKDYGHFPPDSAALIKGKYLKQMPLDALQSTKSTIQYRNTNSCVTVYSLGEDGINDGGCTAQLKDPSKSDYGYVLYPVAKQKTEPTE